MSDGFNDIKYEVKDSFTLYKIVVTKEMITKFKESNGNDTNN
jgi:hypothetical protein